MIPLTPSLENDRIQEVLGTDTDGFDYTESSSLPSTIEITLQDFVSCEAYVGGFDEQEPKSPSPQEVRERGFKKTLAKLAALEVPVKEQIEEYVRDQHRRTCQPNTIHF